MDSQIPSPQTTLAIFLGASAWPDSPEFPRSEAFANAVTGFKNYLFDQKLFGLPYENALDLFDVEDSPHIIDKKMRQFLEQRMEAMQQIENPAKDLLFYFVGHGGFVGRNVEYYLAVRCTSTVNPRISGLPIESLASTLTDKARYLRRMIILDCCYAAAAFTSFQAEGPARLGIDQAYGAFEKQAKKTVGRGTALLCSSGKTVASQVAPDGSCTMFSKALIQALLTGGRDRQDQHYLSLREVADLTEDIIDTVLEGKAPRPEVHSPDQREGNVADVPFFPNSATLSLNDKATPSSQALLGVIPTSSPYVSSLSTKETRPRIESQLLRLSSHRISRRTVVSTGVVVSIGAVGTSIWWLARTTPIGSSPSQPYSFPINTPTPISKPGTLYLMYRGHSNYVGAVTWSPDSKRVASGSVDYTVQVWDAITGGNVLTYRGHTNWLRAVAWSPDGKHISSGGYDNTVQVWDAATGGNTFTYRDTNIVFAVAWSPSSQRIASGSGDGLVQVWDAATGDNAFIYRGHAKGVLAVAWSPDGKHIASGSGDGTVQVWDAVTGSNIFTYRRHAGTLLAVAWSPNSQHIASGSIDNTMQVWDAITGNNIFTYRGHAGWVRAVAWSPDGKHIVSGSADNTVQVCDAATGDNVFTYRGHSNVVSAVAWSPDGKYIASAGQDNTVQVWQAV